VVNRQQTIWGAVGAAGAAVAGLAVGAAARKRSRIAADRRRLATQLTEGPDGPGEQPPGESVSVIADDGLRLDCEQIAPLDGGAPEITVVLVHGFALDRRTWHFQRKALAELPGSTGAPRVHQVLYDVRSHGRSERGPRESCTIEQLGHDLEAVIRTLAPEGPIVLVGHSMGGMTVMALAEQHPQLFEERIIGVGLVSTSAGEVGSAGLQRALLSRRNPLTRGVGLLAKAQPALVETGRRLLGDIIWAITRNFAYGDHNVAPWLVDLVDTMISANAVDALTDFVDTVNSHDRIAALPALAGCEVLVAAGDADRVIPFSHSERIAAELAHATLVRFDGVGHMPMLERHEAMDEALVELLHRSVQRVGGEPSSRSGLQRRLRRQA
jgi:pimeloyl-ACP methyl ester carboxylesterase